MKTIEITAIKEVKYSFIPFGKFILKWNPSKSVEKQLKVLPMVDVDIDDDSRMPYTTESYNRLITYMKKYKTDILQYDGDYYTIMSSDIVRVSHPKLSLFAEFLNQRDYDVTIDNDREVAWKEFTQDLHRIICNHSN